jgi:hypothetical protein
MPPLALWTRGSSELLYGRNAVTVDDASAAQQERKPKVTVSRTAD